MAQRIYAVRVSKVTVAMTQAENQLEAVRQAERHAREIFSDCPNGYEFDELGVVESQAQLAEHGWDEMCLPYGGDGNTRLADILPKESA